MKKFKLFLLIAALLGTFTMTSCSKDDKDSDKGVITNVVFNDQGNTLTVSYTLNDEGITATALMQFFFENDVCTSAIITGTYPSANIAQIIYQEMLEEEDPSTITIRENVITQDVTSEYEGMTKQEIRTEIESMIAMANQAGL